MVTTPLYRLCNASGITGVNTNTALDGTGKELLAVNVLRAHEMDSGSSFLH